MPEDFLIKGAYLRIRKNHSKLFCSFLFLYNVFTYQIQERFLTPSDGPSDLWKHHKVYKIANIKKRIEAVSKSSFDQITVNYYEAGEGIPPHVDNQMAFGEVIISLSLLSDCIMEFKRDENIYKMDLERRSLLIMGTESRYR